MRKLLNSFLVFCLVILSMVSVLSCSVDPSDKHEDSITDPTPPIPEKIEHYTFNLTESPYCNRTRIDTIQDLIRIEEIAVNTGTVEYTINGNKVTYSIKNGEPTRVGPHTKSVTITQEKSIDSFSTEISYDLDSYKGTLRKIDSGYDTNKNVYWAKYNGSVTRAECPFYSYTVTVSYAVLDNS